MTTLEKVGSNICFSGEQARYKHWAESTQCKMRFSIYLPACANENYKAPAIYWLSGLTCTDENFVQKSGAQRWANQHNVAIIAPDTSPRGEDIPDDKEHAWDFGLGAGFYLNATQAPWSKHYNMYDYVTSELPTLIEKYFPINENKSIMGHSMGGHGALTIALKNTGQYQSVSAFSPICNPMDCPWGEKAFSNYLGNDKALWKTYDTCELVAQANLKLPLWVDQGTADSFLKEQLKPENLKAICEKYDHPLRLNFREGYDHSYFYIASFIEEHIAYHAKQLA